MKKILSLVGFCLAFFLFSVNGQEVQAEGTLEHNYFINGVEVKSEVELTQENLEFLYSVGISQDPSEISPFSIDGGGNAGIMISGIHQTKVSQYSERAAVTAFSTFIAQRIPQIQAISFLLGWATFEVSEHMPDRYVGAWTWKVWDTTGYVPQYKIYATAVEYTGESYSTIKKMTVYDAGEYYPEHK